MKNEKQPGTEVILTCKSLKEKSDAVHFGKGYKVIYMDEASFNRDFYLTDLIKMVSGKPIYNDKREQIPTTVRCLDVSKVSSRHYNT